MQNSPAIVFTQDIKLAATLHAMGCPLYLERHVERVQKQYEKEVCFFHFVDNERTREFIAAWNAPTDSWGAEGHPLRDPAHAFWAVRCGLRNRERLLSVVHESKKLCIITHDKNGKPLGKTILVTK